MSLETNEEHQKKESTLQPLCPRCDIALRPEGNAVVCGKCGYLKFTKAAGANYQPYEDDGSGWELERQAIRNAMREEPREVQAQDSIVPDFIHLKDVRPAETMWLWRNMIPFGAITILSGDPGMGKSYLLAEIAAFVVSGKRIPNLFPEFPAMQIPTGSVLWFNAEDSLDKTIVKRLDKAGVDIKKANIYFENGYHTSSGERGSSALSNVDLLRKQLSLTRPTVVFIDTLDSFVGDANNNNATTVRSIMTPVAKLAEEFNCAIICVRHLSKGAQEKALYRGTGSIALTALARSELFFGFDPDDDNEDLDSRRRVIAQVKCSLGRRSPSIAYRIIPDDDDKEQARFIWDGINQNTAEDLVAPGQKDSDEVKSAIDEAMAFLEDYLRDGKDYDASEVKKVAKHGDISERTLKRAKKKLNVLSRQIIDDYGGRHWVWSLKGGDE